MQREGPLIARLRLHEKAARGREIDACQILVGAVRPVQPGYRAALDVQETKLDGRVCGAGVWVSLRHHVDPLGVDLVAVRLGNWRLVHARESEKAIVG